VAVNLVLHHTWARRGLYQRTNQLLHTSSSFSKSRRVLITQFKISIHPFDSIVCTTHALRFPSALTGKSITWMTWMPFRHKSNLSPDINFTFNFSRKIIFLSLLLYNPLKIFKLHEGIFFQHKVDLLNLFNQKFMGYDNFGMHTFL